MTTVTCHDCGYLTAKHEDGHFVEVPPKYRSDGIPGSHMTGVRTPLCFVGACKLETEYVNAEGQTPANTDDRPAIYLGIIRRERSCYKWTEYQPGLDPQGHADVTEAQRDELAKMKLQVAEDRRKHREAMEKMDRDHDAAVSRADKDREAIVDRANQDRAESARQFNEMKKHLDRKADLSDLGGWRQSWVSIVIAVVGAVASIAVAYFKGHTHAP